MEIGDLFHVAHVVDDIDAGERFYDAVFSPSYMFKRHESELDHRTASMMLIADYPAELLVPYPGPVGAAGTIGRFRRRFGEHLHSLAYYCDSIAEWYERFAACGVRVTGDGGVILAGAPARGGIYTHPRDTFGMIEVMEPRSGGTGGAPVGDVLGGCYDPRLMGTHDASWWVREHPLGIVRHAYVTVLTDEVERAVQLYGRLLDARVLGRGGDDRSVFVLVGRSTVVRFLDPRPGTEAFDDLRRDGPMVWSSTFLVADLAAAQKHLSGVGCRYEPGPGGTVVLDRTDALGARYELTVSAPPGDPRG